MQCSIYLEERRHYHILVEKGVVMALWSVSAYGDSDYEIEKDEYFVEYNKEV